MGAQIKVLIEIGELCKKYNIQYFAGFGTLLGAVRHEGFIPWDDDIDILMKREDYERFMSIAKKELPLPYLLLSLYNSNGGEFYSEPLMRIINNSCVDFRQEHLDDWYGCPWIVGIDIFPLDYLPRDKKEDVIFQTTLSLMKRWIFLNANKENEKYAISSDESENILLQLETICNIQINRKKHTKRNIMVLFDKIVSMYKDEKSEEMTDTYLNKYKTHWFDECIYLKFENIMIPATAYYDELLQVVYGDYMIPVQNSAGHDYPFYNKQKQ